jgi:hypothetical protein
MTSTNESASFRSSLVNTGARACLTLALVTMAATVWAQDAPAGRSMIEEIVVTAQKREENINEVGMSIQAATGDRLNELGISDTAELFKVVSGFNSSVTYYGTTIYTIRGVGFQDTALASSPTVSVYLDETPLPYSVMTQGVILDLQRVEALKGPQGRRPELRQRPRVPADRAQRSGQRPDHRHRIHRQRRLASAAALRLRYAESGERFESSDRKLPAGAAQQPRSRLGSVRERRWRVGRPGLRLPQPELDIGARSVHHDGQRPRW